MAIASRDAREVERRLLIGENRPIIHHSHYSELAATEPPSIAFINKRSFILQNPLDGKLGATGTPLD